MSENTSPLTPEIVDAMAYNDLKSKAAELGLEASGTKEALQTRIKAHIGGNAPAAPAAGEQPAAPAAPAEAPAAPAAEASATPQPAAPEAPAAPVLSEAQERAEDAKATRALRESAREMKAALDKQPKVSLMIPFDAGENPEAAKNVPFHINLNGYVMDLPRGQYIEVPQQVADVIKERLESEGKIGREWRVDASSRRADALQ